jgi:ABC-2 type transport system permease protein/lipopolysaccharide transport system permease protein
VSASTVSVVIPTHDRAALLGAAVESVLAQTHPAVEIVVVDDGSTDDTPTVARAFGTRVTYVRQENQGVEAARRHGLAVSNGRYVSFLDDDDVLLPSKLARQAAVLDARPDLGVVHCRYHYVDPEGRHLETVGPQPEGDVLAKLVWGCFPWSGGPLVRRECLDVPDGAHRDWHGDWGMWLHTALAGRLWGCVQEPLGCYRMVPGSMIDGQVANCERLVFNILDDVFARPALPATIRAERDRIDAGWYGWLACRYYASGRSADGARCLRRVLALRPDPAPLAEQIHRDLLTPRVRVHDPLRLLDAIFAGLPPEAAGLAAHRATLVGRVRAGLALRAWGAGDGAGARRHLTAAISTDPGVATRADEFRHELVAWATRLPDERPGAYVTRVLDDLPAEAAPLTRVRTRALEDLGQGPPTLRRRAARAVARVHAPRRLELVAHLVWRELRLRYHGSVLGASWVVLQPLAQLVTLVFLFSRVVPLGIEAYPAFVFSGLLPWAWFSASLAAAGGAFVGNRDLMRRPGFTPALLVVVNVGANLLAYVASVPLLLLVLLANGRVPGVELLLVPLVLLVEGLLVVGLALAVATANVFYRDVQQLVVVALGLLFYLTPVFYRPEPAGAAARIVFAVNPMAAIVAAHRNLWLGTPVEWTALAGAATTAAGACLCGWLVYRRFADELVDRL